MAFYVPASILRDKLEQIEKLCLSAQDKFGSFYSFYNECFYQPFQQNDHAYRERICQIMFEITEVISYVLDIRQAVEPLYDKDDFQCKSENAQTENKDNRADYKKYCTGFKWTEEFRSVCFEQIRNLEQAAENLNCVCGTRLIELVCMLEFNKGTRSFCSHFENLRFVLKKLSDEITTVKEEFSSKIVWIYEHISLLNDAVE